VNFDYDNFVQRYTHHQNNPQDRTLYEDVIDQTGRYWMPVTRRWQNRQDGLTDPALEKWMQVVMQIENRTAEFKNWAFNGDIAFCEFVTRGVLRGRPFEWIGALRFVLRNEAHPRVIEEAAYFDVDYLWSFTDSDRGMQS